MIYAIGVIGIAPYLIEQAYRQESFSFVNRILDDGRDSHALQFYIRIWFLYAWWLWLALTGIGTGLLLVSHDTAHHYVKNTLQQASETRKRYDWRQAIPRRRRLQIHALILFVLLGSLYDIFSGKEHWPFSPYYMYSYVQSETFGWNLIYGVTEQEEEYPLSGKHSGRYLYPYEGSRVARGFFNLNSRPDRESVLKRAVNELIHRYETNRRADRHTGPPLQGIRVYHEVWVMNPLHPSPESPPDRRILLIEVMR